MSNFPKHKNILILGAGITGLQTALSLLTTKHPNLPSSTLKITLLASTFPGSLSPHYTSPYAGGHWRSHVGFSPSEKAVRDWDRRTYERWVEILSEVGSHEESTEEREKRIGLGFRKSRNFWGADGEETEGRDGRGIWWRDVVRDFRVLGKQEIPRGAVMGVEYTSVCINPPRYLEFLFEEVRKLGVRVVKADVETGNGLEGVVRDCNRIFKLDGGLNDGEVIDVLVNCTGISARLFVGGEEAEKIFPIRGQTIIVKGEARKTMTYTGVPGMKESELLYVVPRPGSGTTTLGGCKEVGNWEEGIDDELSERILKGVREEGMLEEGELGVSIDAQGKSKEGFEVLNVNVGFRPGRKGGPRVELEGKIEGCWVVHSYGHSGGGYQCSVGCAERLVEIIDGLDS